MTTSSREFQHLDRKSIAKVTSSIGELARDCVCFANGAGGPWIHLTPSDRTNSGCPLHGLAEVGPAEPTKAMGA